MHNKNNLLQNQCMSNISEEYNSCRKSLENTTYRGEYAQNSKLLQIHYARKLWRMKLLETSLEKNTSREVYAAKLQIKIKYVYGQNMGRIQFQGNL